MCHGEVLLHPLPCASGGTYLTFETKGKEKLNLSGFLFFNKEVFFPPFFPLFSFVLYSFFIDSPR